MRLQVSAKADSALRALLVLSAGIVSSLRGNEGGYWLSKPRARVGEDESITFGADHVHDVVNLGDEPALSIHVYAPRLVSMTFYDDRPACFLDVVRHETLGGTASGAHP